MNAATLTLDTDLGTVAFPTATLAAFSMSDHLGESTERIFMGHVTFIAPTTDTTGTATVANIATASTGSWGGVTFPIDAVTVTEPDDGWRLDLDSTGVSVAAIWAAAQ